MSVTATGSFRPVPLPAQRRRALLLISGLAAVAATTVLLVLWLAHGSSSRHTAAKVLPLAHAVAAHSATHTNVSMLYTLSATSGTLTPVKGAPDVYTLTTHDTDDRVIWFSDAPSRKAGVLPTDGFAREWRGFGFVTDPPNAAITLQNGTPEADTAIAVMTRRPTFDAVTNTFTAQVRLLHDSDRAKIGGNLARHVARADDALPQSFDDVSLFIDDTKGTVVNDCLIQPYAVCEGADLAGAQLSGVNLTGANLALTDLTGADLSNAKLKDADLSGANLTNANLAGANLTNANLTGANLTGADLTGAITTGATMPTNGSAKSALCDSSGTNLTVAPGIYATSLTKPTSSLFGSTGSITFVGPGGTTLTGTLSCQTMSLFGSSSTQWTITVTGTSGTLSTSFPGLTIQAGSSFTGTISGSISNKVPTVSSWNLRAQVQLAVQGATVSATLAASDVHDWTISASGAGLVADTADSSAYTVTSASGTITVAGSAVSGGITLALAGTSPLVAALPATWTSNTSLALTFARSASGSPVTVTSALSVNATSGKNSLSLSGTWAPSGYSLTGGGTIVIGSTSVSVNGWYDSVGYVDSSGTALTAPAWSLTGSVATIPLGNGASITSGSVTIASAAPGITGTLQIQPSSSSSFTIEATLQYTDSSDWSLAVDGQSSSTNWSPRAIPGLSINPNALSGSISDSGGTIAWDVTVGKATWAVTSGTSMTATISLGTDCPLTPGSLCPSQSGIFFGLTNGKLSYPDQPKLATGVQGAVLLDGSWGLLNGSFGSTSVTGPHKVSLSLTGAQAYVWFGSAATPNPIDGLTMPSTDAAAGVGLELCGTFQANLPELGNTAAGGCIERQDGGLVVGQVGMNGSAPGGTDSGITIGGVTFDGWAWSNVANGVTVGLNGTNVTASRGRAQLIGSMKVGSSVLAALGQSGGGTTLPATGWIADSAFDGSETGFDFNASISVGVKSNGFALNSVALQVERASAKWTFSVNAKASYTIDGNSFPVTLSFAAATGSGLTATLTAQGTDSNGNSCTCGVDTALINPSTGWRYLSDDFGAVPGTHLWSTTGQLEFQDGLPGFGVGATVYYDPQSAPNLFHGSTWLQGKFYTNVDYTHPCFDFGFSSSDPNTYVQVQGGVLKTSAFNIEIAPTGCTIGPLTLSPGASFVFDTTLGGASFSVDMSIGSDANGPTFTSDTSITNVTLGRFVFNGTLDINITTTTSSTKFDASFQESFGILTGDYDLTANTDGSIQMTGNVALSNWMSSGNFQINSLTYSVSMNTAGCASFSQAASGNFAVSNKSYAFTGTIAIDCTGLQNLLISFTYTHSGANGHSESQSITLQYSASTGILSGGYTFQYSKDSSHKVLTYTYHRGMTIYISLSFSINFKTPSSSSVTLTGWMDGSDVSGGVSTTLTASGDDSGYASINIHVSSTVKWSDSWTW